MSGWGESSLGVPSSKDRQPASPLAQKTRGATLSHRAAGTLPLADLWHHPGQAQALSRQRLQLQGVVKNLNPDLLSTQPTVLHFHLLLVKLHRREQWGCTPLQSCCWGEQGLTPLHAAWLQAEFHHRKREMELKGGAGASTPPETRGATHTVQPGHLLHSFAHRNRVMLSQLIHLGCSFSF